MKNTKDPVAWLDWLLKGQVLELQNTAQKKKFDLFCREADINVTDKLANNTHYPMYMVFTIKNEQNWAYIADSYILAANDIVPVSFSEMEKQIF